MGELRRDLDLAQEPLAAERGGQLGAQHLERDGAAELEVAGEVDRRHPALPQFALDGVALGEGGPQPLQGVGHRRGFSAASSATTESRWARHGGSGSSRSAR